ncbi:MAG: hypothetical protein J0M12_17370, partial [Deltaproteobacteria bacterium]|nr:hypothetical protein [Deltaproteobacteria bacterium]
NHLELSISNKSDQARSYSVSVQDFPSIQATMPISPFPVAANSRQKAPLFLSFPGDLLIDGKRAIKIVVRDDAGFEKVLDVNVLG